MCANITLADAVIAALRRADAGPFELRAAVPGDHHQVLALLDEAVSWLADRQITAQWGTTPFSQVPRRVAAAEQWVASGGTVLAERDGVPAGALVVGSAPQHVPAAVEPEVYVVLLVGGRGPRARGVGSRLLSLVDDIAAELAVTKARVDCFAGGDGALVRFYESAGFTPVARFDVDGWPGCVLERQAGRHTTPGEEPARA